MTDYKTGSRQSPFGPRPGGLYRNRQKGWAAGVCAGLSDYFSVNVNGIRAGLIILSFIGFFVPILIGYIVLAILLQPAPPHLFKDADDEAFWRSMTRHPADTLGGLARRFRDLDDRLARMEQHVTSPEEALRSRFRDL